MATQDPTPQKEEPEVIASSLKQAQFEKAEKERKDLLNKQLKQGIVDDKNSKKLTLTLTKVIDVLKGIPTKNDKAKEKQSLIGKEGGVGDSIKNAVKTNLEDRKAELKNKFSLKGVAGVMAAKYAEKPGSIMGSVYGAIHSHLDDKDKAKQEKQDFHEGFLGGTDIGRKLKQDTRNEQAQELRRQRAENKEKPKKNQLSNEDLKKKVQSETDEKLKAETGKIFDETKKIKAELDQLKSKAASLKAKGDGVGVKGVFGLSKEEQAREKKLTDRLSAVAHGADIHAKQKVQAVPFDPDPADKQAADAARDKALGIFKKNNNIETMTDQDEKKFEQEMAANKAAKIRARDENNKIRVANESVSEAMKQGAFEAHKGDIEGEANRLNKDGEGDITPEAVEKQKEHFYSEMFKDIMADLNKLSADQLEELHAIREALEGDNKHDAKREAKLDDKADDGESKIQKAQADSLELKQRTILSNSDMLGNKAAGKDDKKDEKEKESNGIMDMFDLNGPDGNRRKAGKGNMMKNLGKAARFAGSAALVAGAGYAGYEVGSAIYESQGENIQDGLGKITGADADHDQALKNADSDEELKLAKKKIAAGEPISQNLADKVRGKIEIPEDLILKKGQNLQQWKAAREPQAPPEKPAINPTKEIIDEKSDAVAKAKSDNEVAKQAPSVVNAPTVNNKTTNNNTTITREPIRAEDQNLPWRQALFT